MGGPEADKIERLFDSISGDYDKLNHLLSLGIDRTWRKRALSEILPTPAGWMGAASAGSESPYAVLDVACGTGDFSLEIARRCARRGLNCARKSPALDFRKGALNCRWKTTGPKRRAVQS